MGNHLVRSFSIDGHAGTLLSTMKVRDLRDMYVRFFESKGHKRFPSGSLVPIDVTGKLDESLLFNGAGMIQFKPYFRGIAQPDSKRLVTVQKCVRTGDIDEVGDDTHLTFFEMLGNFSFGDYFKADAIAFSWEFLTSKEWLGIDPAKLSFTVFESDDEAVAEWSKYMASDRIIRLDEETNYWPAGAFSKGPPGPCGPNSEMFYWVSDAPVPGPGYTREDWIRDDEAGNWVEIWNDVFIQYEWQGKLRNPSNPKEGYEKSGTPDLPFRSIDTGMGLERTALVLSGGKSVYDSDVFEPIFAALDSVARPSQSSVSQTAPDRVSGEFEIRQGANLPDLRSVGSNGTSARRIIADHIRTSVFCIADGVLPSNTGRGYVLRRLIRRAVLKGQRVLGFDEPFFHLVYEGVVKSMGDFYPELIERRDVIIETLRNEETQFRKTLAAGTELLQAELQATTQTLSGAVAFRLYDTFGFPLEVTQELASEAGVGVDLDGYEQALKEAQQRSRGAQGDTSAYGGVSSTEEKATDDAPPTTDFLGYTEIESPAKIVRVRKSPSPQRGEGRGEGARLLIALDKTPFYAESGGQTGDIGTLTLGEQALKVTNTTKSAGTFWHEVEGSSDDILGLAVEAHVDSQRRARIKRNHTATHLLHAALRQVLGTHVTQAGSYVGPENLRFDFTHGKGMTDAEKQEVERIVNEQILANTDVVTYVDLPIAEARAKGAMALFGEKYGDKVRMVEVGEFSKELCGGIHVRTTGEIGQFRIVSENSAASGVRRIEAITGEAAYALALEDSLKLQEIADALKANPKEVVNAVHKSLESLKEERKKREKAEMAALSGGGGAEAAAVEVNGVALWVRNFGEVDQKIASQAVDNEAAQHPNQVTIAAVIANGKPVFICKAGKDAVAKGAHAGNLLKEIAKIAGGGGGGRPDFATAGGREISKVEEAISKAEELLRAQLG